MRCEVKEEEEEEEVLELRLSTGRRENRMK